ncbi:MAG: hypothetical protein HY508_03450 [Acidobacteria bacterium]|nr:hypothetical protein [Acidobacteriota bacterium]
MPSRNLTFQTFLPGCEKGEADSWRAFLTNYNPIVFRLLDVYAPQMGEEAGKSLWRDALQALSAENFHRLRGFDHQAEREFLIDLKGFVLDLALQRFGGAPGDASQIIDHVRSRIEGRPMAHQEIILLNLGGYSPEALEKVLVLPPTLVAKALESSVGAEPAPSGLGSARSAITWLEFLHEVHAERTPDCPPRRIFVRILDGQVSWYDKTPAEKHMTRCLHCLEVWASLREVDSLRRETAPLPDDELSEYLSALPIATATAARASWMGKLLGR